MAVILGVAIAITIVLLPLSIYPGLLSELAFFALISSPFWMPALCISSWFYVDMLHEVRDLFGPPPGHRRRLVAAMLVLVLNGGMLWWGVPRRLAFLHARPAFEAAVAAPTLSCVGGGIDRRLGVYQVDRFDADPRGGVFFRTRSGPDGFNSSRMSYGFSHRPNPDGSPFGDEKYALSHVVGDWYVFQASLR